MQRRDITVRIMVLLIILPCLVPDAMADEITRLMGRIQMDYIGPTENSRTALLGYRDFKIEILELSGSKDESARTGKALIATYPDMRGYFSFKNIPEGRYYIQVSYLAPGELSIEQKKVSVKKIKIKYNDEGRQRLFPIRVEVITVPNSKPGKSGNVH